MKWDCVCVRERVRFDRGIHCERPNLSDIKSWEVTLTTEKWLGAKRTLCHKLRDENYTLLYVKWIYYDLICLFTCNTISNKNTNNTIRWLLAKKILCDRVVHCSSVDHLPRLTCGKRISKQPDYLSNKFPVFFSTVHASAYLRCSLLDVAATPMLPLSLEPPTLHPSCSPPPAMVVVLGRPEPRPWRRHVSAYYVADENRSIRMHAPWFPRLHTSSTPTSSLPTLSSMSRWLGRSCGCRVGCLMIYHVCTDFSVRRCCDLWLCYLLQLFGG